MDEQRREERVPHTIRVLLQFSPTLGFVGTTADVSPHGAFVRLPHPPHQVKKGDEGEFRVMFNREKYLYRFRVQRITGGGMGVRFIDTPPDFVIRMLRER